MPTLRRRLSPLALGFGLALSPFASAQEASQYINNTRMLDDPPARVTNRITLADDLGGWKVYTGQLHSHTRGHDSPSAVLSWPRVWGMAWAYGYDFFSRNNHSTSWQGYDSNRPFLEEHDNADGKGVVMINGQENYYDGGNHGPEPPDHPNHYNTINAWPEQRNGNLAEFYSKILPGYNADPQRSVHVQLNHVAQATADYTKLPVNAVERERLRRIVDTAEILHGDGKDQNHMDNLRSYFTLLRNGWRVSPTAQYDVHADRDNNSTWGARKPDGSFLRPWIHYPGQPYEVVQRANGEQNFAPHGRTGMITPAATPWGSSAFLAGLSDRRTFRTTMDRSVGMYAAGGRVMGDEFSLADNSELLKFKVWGYSFAQHDGSRAPFTRAELWSPARPGAPVRTVDLGNTTDFGAELFALTPYESVYLVRLVGAYTDNDVVMSPVWINNPRERLNSAAFLFPTPYGGQLLMWSGGGKRVQIQRARVHAPHYPKNWETVAEVDNIGRYAYDVSNDPVYTYWRVVDASDPGLPSNEVLFTRPNQSPRGAFEQLNVAAGTLRGWTYDPDHPASPVTVHVYSGNTFVTSGVTGLPRPDVQQSQGAGAYSGFEIALPADFRSGLRSFSIYALDLDAEPNPLLGGSPRSGNFGNPDGGGSGNEGEPDPLCERKPWLQQCNPGGG